MSCIPTIHFYWWTFRCKCKK